MMPRPVEPASIAAPRPFGSNRRLLRILAALVLGVAVVWYFAFLRRNCASYAVGSDVAGYMNIARLLREGQLVQHVPKIEGLDAPAWDFMRQQPLGFAVDRHTGRMVPTYPVGLPLHYVAIAPWVGLAQAPVVISLAFAFLSAVLMIGFARTLGLPWLWALAGVAILWACPLFLFLVFQPLSDLPAMVWTLAALWAALLARRHPGWGLAAGAAMAIAVLVRPTNLLLIVPIGVALGLRWRAWLALAIGGLPGAAFLAWYNLKLYGAVMATGYGEVGYLFGLRFLRHNALHFAWWIPVLVSPPVALAVLAWPRLIGERFIAILFGTWAAVFVGFYIFYFHSGETWWYLRFILPMFPTLILGALLVAHRWTESRPAGRPGRFWLFVALAFVLVWEARAARILAVNTQVGADAMYRDGVTWMQTRAPRDAIVLQMQFSGTFTYYTTFTIVRWDLLSPAEWSRLRSAAAAAHRPIYATLFDFEESTFPSRLPGTWQLLVRWPHTSIWRLAEPAGGTAK